MVGTSGKRGRGEKYIQSPWLSLKGRDHSEGLDVGARVI